MKSPLEDAEFLRAELAEAQRALSAIADNLNCDPRMVTGYGSGAPNIPALGIARDAVQRIRSVFVPPMPCRRPILVCVLPKGHDGPCEPMERK